MEGGEGSQSHSHQFDIGHLQHQYQEYQGQMQQVMNDNRQNVNIVNSLNDRIQEEVKESDINHGV
jgi:phosphoglycerate-specific signal transduction histidine kinase